MMWQTVSGTPHSIAKATPVNGGAELAALALARLALHFLVLQELAYVGQDRAGNHRVHVDGQCTAHELLMLSAASRAMCTTQRLCSMKVVGQLGTRSVNGMRFRSVRRERAELQRAFPGASYLLA